VEKGVAILHGEAPDRQTADQVETAVAAVAGVREVRSHLTPRRNLILSRRGPPT
jgi:osmotically-inducible protein OsmY